MFFAEPHNLWLVNQIAALLTSRWWISSTGRQIWPENMEEKTHATHLWRLLAVKPFCVCLYASCERRVCVCVCDVVICVLVLPGRSAAGCWPRWELSQAPLGLPATNNDPKNDLQFIRKLFRRFDFFSILLRYSLILKCIKCIKWNIFLIYLHTIPHNGKA